MTASLLPSRDEFEALAATARFVPVYRQLTADTLTPVTVFRQLAAGRHAFLFESVVGGERIGRYSFVGSQPFRTMTATGRTVRTTDSAGSVREYECPDPLAELDRLIGEYHAAQVPGLPHFCGGAVGYAAYDVVRYSEHLPNVPEDDRHLPDLSFAFYDAMVVFDHIRKVVLVVALADTGPSPSDSDGRASARRAAEERIEQICRQLETPATGVQLAAVDLTVEPDPELRSNFSREGFYDAVERAREYIRAGDIFQVVLSQRFRHHSAAHSLDIYRALRMVNPSPFMFLLQTPDAHLVGSSPEILVRVEDGEATIRPLAGTRRRGQTPAEDRELAEELLDDPKERAEHVMLIDLARNDVGRVAQFGSVQLSDVMVVERYSHVMHITSNVSGRLTEGLSPIAALRAGLPAGTVSGAPKVRAMEIIDEVEPHKRGPYGGAVGYIDFTGNMDTCIALRTIVIREGVVDIQAGAGIVADSQPEAEYQETLNKARAMLKAIHIAETQLCGGGADS